MVINVPLLLSVIDYVIMWYYMCCAEAYCLVVFSSDVWTPTCGPVKGQGQVLLLCNINNHFHMHRKLQMQWPSKLCHNREKSLHIMFILLHIQVDQLMWQIMVLKLLPSRTQAYGPATCLVSTKNHFTICIYMYILFQPKLLL